MSPDTVKAISDALAPLASKLEQTGGHVYQIFTRQQYITGIVGIVWGVVMLMISMVLAYNLARLIKWDVEDGTDGAISTMVVITGIGLFFLGTLVLLDGFQHLMNPEYYTITDILQKATGK